MSTPSGMPFDPFDLSPYAPKRARERSTLDQPPVENDSSDSNNDKSANDAAVVLPYAPRAAMRPEAAEEHPVDLDAADQAPSRPDASGEQVAAKPAAAATPADPDLARLESSLQWLQREGAVGRLPRAVQLPPISGLRPVNPDGPRPRSEQFINGVRVPPSLAPERLRPPPPMRERRDNLRGPVRVLLASLIAAPIAYYFSVGNLPPILQPARESGLASFASRLVASSEFPIPKEKLRPSEAEDYNTVVSSRNKLVAQPSAQAASSARAEASAALPPGPVPDQVAPAAPASKAVRELDPQAIKLLMQQGEQFMASGDLITARLVFRRAAEAGNAAAALALGATFDPAVLARIGVRGMGADIEKARSWYEKAKEFGSPEAPRRLEMLANR
jgi:TPR repeat protein